MSALANELQYVCDDHPSNEMKWYYADGVYYRKSGDEVVKTIKGRILPHPHVLWKRRQEKCPGRPKQELKPREATYKLWEHWQNVSTSR